MDKSFYAILFLIAFFSGILIFDKSTESKRCQKVVLRDIKAHAAYAEELRATVGSTDFLTEMTRGQK